MILRSFSLLLAAPLLVQGGETALRAHHFTVAEGWQVSVAAEPPLVHSPIEMSMDEKGRLYVTESSGSNEPVAVQQEKKPHRVLRLTDRDGDGVFDEKRVFADALMFPEGCLWYAGSLYVAAPPVIWKLTDTDDDGVAEKREVWLDGKTCTGCANDLHGPYLGPDSWIYWCKGAFAEQTWQVDGKEWKTRASHIFRARPDGSGMEPVMTGGMDNPVGLTWTAEGERILSCTFVQHPAGGRRDALLHAVWGGVWGKDHDVIHDHLQTGPLMPVMTHLGPAAPAGLATLRSGEVLASQFNLRKVSRHMLQPAGASFTTADDDFLASDHADFHPTDVMECPDGSVLVVDTGGWYKLCCPTSQLAKPDIPGAIYRLKRTTPAAPQSPHPSAEIFAAMQKGELSAVRAALHPEGGAAAQTAALCAALTRDAASIPALLECLTDGPAPLARAAAEALERCGAGEATRALCLRAAGAESDRMLEHSCLHALCLTGDSAALHDIFTTADSAPLRRVALFALIHRDAASLHSDAVLPLLLSAHDPLASTAADLITTRTDWHDALRTWLPAQPADARIKVLRALSPRLPLEPELRACLSAAPDSATRTEVLHILQGTLPGMEKLPAAWSPLLADALQGPPPECAAALSVLQAHPAEDAASLVPALSKRWTDSDAARRMTILTLMPHTDWPLESTELLSAQLAPDIPPAQRLQALHLLAAAPPSDKLSAALLRFAPRATVMELAPLVQALAVTPDADTGIQLLDSLASAKTLATLPEEGMRKLLEPFPAPVRSHYATLRAQMRQADAARLADLDKLLTNLPAGDPGRGHIVFQSAKAACMTCHQAGYKGGTLGPDLTRIGAVRTPRDLLESIVAPSASFVRSYEPMLIESQDGSTAYGIVRNQSAETLTLAVAPGTELTLPMPAVKSITNGPFSLMPAGLAQILGPQDLADLIAFLASLK